MRWRMIVPAAMLAICCGTQAFAKDVVVACGPGQHAIVRDSFARGEAVTHVQCASDRAYRTVAYRQERVRRPHRSWAKTALIIGGSTAAGAGVGGIVHGGKGALVGAALAGGAASIYEGAKRR